MEIKEKDEKRKKRPGCTCKIEQTRRKRHEKDGIFWWNNERWLRENGKEYRLAELAPNLEANWRKTPLIFGEWTRSHLIYDYWMATANMTRRMDL